MVDRREFLRLSALTVGAIFIPTALTSCEGGLESDTIPEYLNINSITWPGDFYKRTYTT